MKAIYLAEGIKAWDAYSLKEQQIGSFDLMKRACAAFVRQFVLQYDTQTTVQLVCGQGNNGGDGLLTGLYLHEKGYTVKIFMPASGIRASSERQEALAWVQSRQPGILFHAEEPVMLSRQPESVVIDALLGTGTNRPLEGALKAWVEAINRHPGDVIALDVPSGMAVEATVFKGLAVKADHTFTFQSLKPAMLFAENAVFVGKAKVLNIGLSATFSATTPPWAFLTEQEDVKTVFPPRSEFSHKGDFGHALLLAGSYGKTGAAILAAEAALRVGCGKITVHVPTQCISPLQSAVPEAMVSPDSHPERWTSAPSDGKYSGLGAGPGLDTVSDTALAFTAWLESQSTPLVLDADALNLLSLHPHLLNHLPAHSLLTPHKAECERLLGKMADWPTLLETSREFAVRHTCILILKNRYTFICLPDKRLYVNPTGNPGMATAGSGDVLCGILLGLLAKGLPPEQAALAGVYLHGLAGDLAAHKKGQESLLARDIVHYLPEAMLQIQSCLLPETGGHDQLF